MQTNYQTLIVSLIGALNTLAISFGFYHFNDQQLDAINKLVSIGLIIWGIWKNHHHPAEKPTDKTKA